MATDAFVRWRGTILWRAVDAALARAAEDGFVHFVEAGREAAIGELCMSLDAERLVIGTRRSAVADVLQRAGWREEDFADSLALELCALFDNQASVDAVADYLERFETELEDMKQSFQLELDTRPPSTFPERLALAGAAHRAYMQVDQSDATPA